MSRARRTAPRTMARTRERRTGLVVWSGSTRQGTPVHVASMPGFRHAYAVLTTRYGSVDTRLPDGGRIPDGTAHFLEHKMFQTPEGDVFDVYAARGASANAFTTFTQTSYLFSCTDRFEENLDTLVASLVAVETDAAGIAREKGIIGQEIAMYDDDPSWRGYFNLLQALYRHHPVRIDIAGTARSIAPIDRGLLERVHRAYYHPRNLVLVVAGDVDPEAVRARAEVGLGDPGPGRRLRRRPVAEPAGVARREVRQPLSISRPHVLLGLKDRPVGGGRRLVRRHVESALVLDALFGDGGRIEAPLYEEGIVDDSLHATYEGEPDHAHAIVAAEVDEVRPYQRRLERALEAAARDGLSTAEVERARRRMLGRHLRTFNAPERVAHWVLAAALEGVAPDAALEVLEAATRASLRRRLRELVAAPRAWSVLVPRDA